MPIWFRRQPCDRSKALGRRRSPGPVVSQPEGGDRCRPRRPARTGRLAPADPAWSPSSGVRVGPKGPPLHPSDDGLSLPHRSEDRSRHRPGSLSPPCRLRMPLAQPVATNKALLVTRRAVLRQFPEGTNRFPSHHNRLKFRSISRSPFHRLPIQSVTFAESRKPKSYGLALWITWISCIEVAAPRHSSTDHCTDGRRRSSRAAFDATPSAIGRYATDPVLAPVHRSRRALTAAQQGDAR